MESPNLQFSRITEFAITPCKASSGAAGYDLFSAHHGIIPKRGKAKFFTDLRVKIPAGSYGRIAPRSGLASKSSIDVGAGVIDEDFRGNVAIILFNHGNEDFQVHAGDRIAQLICQKIFYPTLEEIVTKELLI
jgi:dUTP pyrophosphatase